MLPHITLFISLFQNFSSTNSIVFSSDTSKLSINMSFGGGSTEQGNASALESSSNSSKANETVDIVQLTKIINGIKNELSLAKSRIYIPKNPQIKYPKCDQCSNTDAFWILGLFSALFFLSFYVSSIIYYYTTRDN
ncbi:hypothetical protein DFJ63DRAFT_315608 [Scheffersomyces coipomensis]|uniref:uncharacterized protein n=1 Tax=Scheffersomyces coipomensis TaxID=1788519 RepID=UPI00315C862D